MWTMLLVIIWPTTAYTEEAIINYWIKSREKLYKILIKGQPQKEGSSIVVIMIFSLSQNNYIIIGKNWNQNLEKDKRNK